MLGTGVPTSPATGELLGDIGDTSALETDDVSLKIS